MSHQVSRSPSYVPPDAEDDVAVRTTCPTEDSPGTGVRHADGPINVHPGGVVPGDAAAHAPAADERLTLQGRSRVHPDGQTGRRMAETAEQGRFSRLVTWLSDTWLGHLCRAVLGCATGRESVSAALLNNHDEQERLRSLTDESRAARAQRKYYERIEPQLPGRAGHADEHFRGLIKSIAKDEDLAGLDICRDREAVQELVSSASRQTRDARGYLLDQFYGDLKKNCFRSNGEFRPEEFRRWYNAYAAVVRQLYADTVEAYKQHARSGLLLYPENDRSLVRGQLESYQREIEEWKNQALSLAEGPYRFDFGVEVRDVESWLATTDGVLNDDGTPNFKSPHWGLVESTEREPTSQRAGGDMAGQSLDPDDLNDNLDTGLDDGKPRVVGLLNHSNLVIDESVLTVGVSVEELDRVEAPLPIEATLDGKPVELNEMLTAEREYLAASAEKYFRVQKAAEDYVDKRLGDYLVKQGFERVDEPPIDHTRGGYHPDYCWDGYTKKDKERAKQDLREAFYKTRSFRRLMESGVPVDKAQEELIASLFLAPNGKYNEQQAARGLDMPVQYFPHRWPYAPEIAEVVRNIPLSKVFDICRARSLEHQTANLGGYDADLVKIHRPGGALPAETFARLAKVKNASYSEEHASDDLGTATVRDALYRPSQPGEPDALGLFEQIISTDLEKEALAELREACRAGQTRIEVSGITAPSGSGPHSSSDVPGDVCLHVALRLPIAATTDEAKQNLERAQRIRIAADRLKQAFGEAHGDGHVLRWHIGGEVGVTAEQLEELKRSDPMGLASKLSDDFRVTAPPEPLRHPQVRERNLGRSDRGLVISSLSATSQMARESGSFTDESSRPVMRFERAGGRGRVRYNVAESKPYTLLSDPQDMKDRDAARVLYLNSGLPSATAFDRDPSPEPAPKFYSRMPVNGVLKHRLKQECYDRAIRKYRQEFEMGPA